MIQYTEKGAALHDEIARAGHTLAEVDGVWVADDEAAVQAIMDAYTLDQAKGARCAEVARHAKELRDRIISAYSAGEMSSWPIKLSEAAKFTATGRTADAPLLSIEAQARGVTLAELVAKVDANAQGFSMLEAQISGIDGKHRDAIAALPDFAAVAAYDYSAGWPVA